MKEELKELQNQELLLLEQLLNLQGELVQILNLYWQQGLVTPDKLAEVEKIVVKYRAETPELRTKIEKDLKKLNNNFQET